MGCWAVVFRGTVRSHAPTPLRGAISPCPIVDPEVLDEGREVSAIRQAATPALDLEHELRAFGETQVGKVRPSGTEKTLGNDSRQRPTGKSAWVEACVQNRKRPACHADCLRHRTRNSSPDIGFCTGAVEEADAVGRLRITIRQSRV